VEEEEAAARRDTRRFRGICSIVGRCVLQSAILSSWILAVARVRAHVYTLNLARNASRVLEGPVIAGAETPSNPGGANPTSRPRDRNAFLWAILDWFLSLLGLR